MKLVYSCLFLLKGLYQARKMSSHVYVHCHLVATNNVKRRLFGPMKLVYPCHFLLKCLYHIKSNNSGMAKVKIVKNERDPPLFTSKQLIKS
jgi:hypothetical protein